MPVTADTDALGAEPDTAELAALAPLVDELGGRPAPRLAPGTVLADSFEIGEVLGSGGMGIVYRARDVQLERSVALKLHRPMARGTERLLREASSMARLAHPNVATVHEVGTHEGMLFIAMELIDGVTARRWVAQTERSVAEIVALYHAAGRGLAAAHRAGLVHRDFKPENVLVGPDDVPRVVDFGLARSIEDGGRVDTLSPVQEPSPVSRSGALTRTGAAMGTPAYMAPEQLDGIEVDARADQFAFGVSLFEALFGRRPFSERSMQARVAEILAGRLELPAQPRVPSRVRRVIVRALAPEPEQRFESMDALLDGLGPDPRAARRRTWATVVGAAAGAAGLVAALLRGTPAEAPCTDGATRLEGVWDDERRGRVRDAILAAEVEYAPDVWAFVEPRIDAHAERWIEGYTDACSATHVRHEQSAEVMDLRMGCLRRLEAELNATVGTLAGADAALLARAHSILGGMRSPSRCDDVEALQAQTAPPSAAEAPMVEALRERLAQARAERHAGRFAAARRQIDDVESDATPLEYGPLRAEVAYEKGRVLAYLREDQAAEATMRDALRLGMRWRQWDLVQRAARALLFNVGYRQRRGDEGLRYRELAEELAQGDPRAGSMVRESVGLVLGEMGRHDDARAQHQQAIALAKQGWSDEFESASAHENFALTLQLAGEHAEAEAELRHALRLSEAALGSRHPNVASIRGNLGMVLWHQGRYPEAETELRRALALEEALFGADHLELAGTYRNLALALESQRHLPQAEQQHRRALAIYRANLRSDHPDIAEARANLAIVLGKKGRVEEAVQEEREVIRLLEASRGAEHPGTLLARANLASDLAKLRQYDEAEAELRAVLPMLEQALGAEHPNVALLRIALADVLQSLGRLDDAESLLGPAVAQLERALPAEHPHLALARLELAVVLADGRRFEEARPLAESAWERNRREDVSATTRAENAFVLARILWSGGAQLGRARSLAEQARDEYAADEGEPESMSIVEAWLRQHPVP